MNDHDLEVVLSGSLRKKKSRGNTWAERYFILKGHVLEYYVKSTDQEPKGSLPILHNTQVTKITTDVGKKRQQFIFRVSNRVEEENEDKDEPNTTDNTRSSRGSKKKSSSNETSGTKIAAAAVGGAVLGALSSGIGLVAGMMVVGMGAAAGGTAAIAGGADYKDKGVTLACDTYHEAETWVNAIESQIQDLADNILGLPAVQSKCKKVRSIKNNPHPEVRIAEVQDWMTTNRWKVTEVFEGIRILEPFQSVDDESSPFHESFFNKSKVQAKDFQSPPCLRINMPINAAPFEAFTTIINSSEAIKAGVIESIRVVHSIDNNTDIIHLKLHPVFLSPSWTTARDFCLIRYWRDNSDGSYVICYDSTIYNDCPPIDDYVRGEMHAAYVIVPSKPKVGVPVKDNEDEDTGECMVSFIAQMDPKGWIWSSLGYRRAFLREFMFQILDIRDALDADRYLQVHFDPTLEASICNNDSSVNVGGNSSTTVQGDIASIPPPALSPTMWRDVDASTFRVRGATYNTDKEKTASAPQLFKLIAIDLFEVTEPTPNIAAHPRNRVFLASQRGETSWVFVMNIMVPGPPYLSFVAYFLGDKTLIDADTPFGRIARPFFYGNDDEFRNNRFKLIPKIIDGNLIIKMAVKDTPTLLGNKLKQYYHKGDNYFELDVDVGSSSVARNVVGLAMGYSKAIVVDMGLTLQGNAEEELPEILFGGCSCVHVDASTAKKL